MKKILSMFVLLLALSACGENTFKGKEYKLENAPHNADITLGFGKAEDRFFGSVVNRYFGVYKKEGDSITFSSAGSTMMMGPEPLMAVENKYLQSLPFVRTFSLDGKKLILKDVNDKEYVFKEIGKIKE